MAKDSLTKALEGIKPALLPSAVENWHHLLTTYMDSCAKDTIVRYASAREVKRRLELEIPAEELNEIAANIIREEGKLSFYGIPRRAVQQWMKENVHDKAKPAPKKASVNKTPLEKKDWNTLKRMAREAGMKISNKTKKADVIKFLSNPSEEEE